MSYSLAQPHLLALIAVLSAPKDPLCTQHFICRYVILCACYFIYSLASSFLVVPSLIPFSCVVALANTPSVMSSNRTWASEP